MVAMACKYAYANGCFHKTQERKINAIKGRFKQSVLLLLQLRLICLEAHKGKFLQACLPYQLLWQLHSKIPTPLRLPAPNLATPGLGCHLPCFPL
jgi:hypothetical protein